MVTKFSLVCKRLLDVLCTSWYVAYTQFSILLGFPFYWVVELRKWDLESEPPRFAYNEPVAGTSACDDTIAESGWKFVFATNQ